MIKIQHQKVFHVYFGIPGLKMSSELTKAISVQLIDEDMGVPVLDDCLKKTINPDISWYVNFYILIRFMLFVYAILYRQIHLPIFAFTNYCNQFTSGWR